MVCLMAITATLVHAGHNRLRYLLSTLAVAGDTGVITTTGAATPDILTDLGTNQGPLMAMAKVITLGYGQFAAGVQTQAKARALWLSDRSVSDPAASLAGLNIVTTAICRLTPRTGLTASWWVDAGIDGGGNPVINVSALGVSDGEVAGTCYLDIYVPDTIGD
jgi:hypothetical protein